MSDLREALKRSIAELEYCREHAYSPDVTTIKRLKSIAALAAQPDAVEPVALSMGTYSKDIEHKMMEVADLIAATLEQPSDRRAWDRLMIYAPRDALERRLSKLNQGEHHDTVLAPSRADDEVRQRHVDRGGLEPRNADQVANEQSRNVPLRVEVSDGGDQRLAPLAPDERMRAPELKPWRDELSEIIGHLGSAITQSVAGDDQIIMDHVKAAHEIAKIVRRKA